MGNIRNARVTHPNKKRRQENAKRALEYKRSVQEQLHYLNAMGYRAVKERRKLAKILKGA